MEPVVTLAEPRQGVSHRPSVSCRRAISSAVFVVFLAPGFDHRSRAKKVREPVLIEALIAHPAVEALNVGVLVWLARFDQAWRVALAMGSFEHRLATELLPVAVRMICGRPRDNASRFITRTTPCREMTRSTSMATALCVASSTMVWHSATRPQLPGRTQNPATRLGWRRRAAAVAVHRSAPASACGAALAGALPGVAVRPACSLRGVLPAEASDGSSSRRSACNGAPEPGSARNAVLRSGRGT